MIEYYKQLLEKTKNHAHIIYYENMLMELKNIKSRKRKRKQTLNSKPRGKVKVYVEHLNKEFKSGTAASKALGYNKNYVLQVTKGVLPNKYGIRLI